ncbi:hypothetical protein R1sor_020686 [Riccia sorocarpa]|uniref:Uncharacterized protein n=1 Tax=Riccia sorocarpa TaxID=122646 RepID=A0ABD3GEV9_9MARC
MPHMSRLRAELLWKSCIAHELVTKATSLKPVVKQEDMDMDMDINAEMEPHSDNGEDMDIVELDKVLQPGDDVELLLQDLLDAGYNVAKNPSTVGTKQSRKTEIPAVDLDDLDADALGMDLMLKDLLFAGNKLESKRKTTRMDVCDVQPLPAYIPLCRSSAASDLQKEWPLSE